MHTDGETLCSEHYDIHHLSDQVISYSDSDNNHKSDYDGKNDYK